MCVITKGNTLICCTHVTVTFQCLPHVLCSLTLNRFAPDKRVENWPMMSSPLPTLAISCLYLLFLWAGPRYMQDRQPYTLRKTLIVYNFSMVVLNFYIAKEVSVITALTSEAHNCITAYITRSPDYIHTYYI